MICSNCDDMRYTIIRLQERIASLEERLQQEQRRIEKADSRIRDLEPYKVRADRAYDHYVTTPKDMP